jgi:signal transduction histidine kinase/FixJ family two-component response regulator
VAAQIADQIQDDALRADRAESDSDPGLHLRFPIHGLSFQSRVAVVALVTAVAVLLGACMLFMLQQWRTERAHFIQSQQMLAGVEAADISSEMRRQPAAVPAALQALNGDQRLSSAELVGPNGARLASYSRTAGAKGGEAAGAISVRAPVDLGAGAEGELVLSVRPDGPGALVPRFVSMGGALFFVAAGIALFMGRWLAGRLTRPVDRLSRVMHEVAGSGDFTQRVLHGENDEFGRLTDSFNALLADLESHDRALHETMDELVEARDAAEAANVLKSHFLANMSHEIRTPLNGVLAMAQIMGMGEMAPKQRERLGVIQQSGEALLTVLNDILDLSKIEAGRMELEEADFDTDEFARTLEAAHQPAAAAKGLSFSVEVAPQALGVRRGDPTRLQQILNNLLANAVKFTHAGEVRVRIEGEGEVGRDGLRISITDTGIGVPSDKLPLLFQKFSQVDSSTTRQFGGTGLGLAICRELAQLMDGNVWAESIQGVGSTFFVSVPLRRVSVANGNAAAARNAAPQPSAAEIASLRILAAEDNATNQLVLKTVISTFGLEVDIVPDGQKALEAWSGGGYDLILMDIQMPVMDGITATREIRAAEARTGRRRTPIIALSANAMVHQVKEYLNAGMDMHVAKPIQLAKLHQALERVLNEAQADARAHAQVPPARDAVA